MVLCARMGCRNSEGVEHSGTAASPASLLSHPPFQKSTLSKEGILTHRMMLDLPPPPGPEAGMPEHLFLLPASRGISQLHWTPKALPHPPMAGLGERGQAACPVTAPNPLILPPGLCLISPQTSPSIELPHAQELCLPPHDVPQNNETFANV